MRPVDAAATSPANPSPGPSPQLPGSLCGTIPPPHPCFTPSIGMHARLHFVRPVLAGTHVTLVRTPVHRLLAPLEQRQIDCRATSWPFPRVSKHLCTVETWFSRV